MSPATYLAFFDELRQIKTAGLLQNVGMRIATTAKSAPRVALNYVKAVPGEIGGGIQNAGKGIGAFGTPVQSLKAGWRTSVSDFGKMDPTMKALMGFGLLTSGHEAISKDDPIPGKNRGRVERVGAAVGDQVGGLMGSPFGFGGSAAASMVGRKAGGLAGKGVDLIRGRKKPTPQPETIT